MLDALCAWPDAREVDRSPADHLAAVEAAAALREDADRAIFLLVRQAQREPRFRRPSDASLAAVLGMSTSAFSRRFGQDTWEARRSPMSR